MEKLKNCLSCVMAALVFSIPSILAPIEASVPEAHVSTMFDVVANK